jgi:HPt (histidine-containing phosphotransfer) domain-containing protein
MSAAPLDPEIIASIRALAGDEGDDFLREIIGIFLEDTPLRFTELEDALRLQDTAKFARAAHSIKGSSSNVGALGLRAEAEALEQKTLQGWDGAAESIERLKQEFERTRQALKALLV